MSDNDSEREPVEMLAESFVEHLRRGQNPPVSEYVARSPEHAEEILDLFPALVEMELAKRSHPALEIHPETPADTPERLGDYRILRFLGAGGMGVVYEAERESLRSHVALKVLHPRFRIDPTYLARFRNEARSAAQLHHTNIVTVFDYGEQDGVFYYAMQYIPGQGLDKVLEDVRRLRKDHPRKASSERPVDVNGGDPALSVITEALLSGRFAMPTPEMADPKPSPARAPVPATPTAPESIADRHPSKSSSAMKDSSAPESSGSFGGMSDRTRYYREVARIGLQLADALAYAHARGVVHRDIKPANLILDARGNVWVTDFGLAKFEDQDLSNSQDIVGTLRYMAPERFRGVTSPSVDIYALGATLYELLTLRPVFDSVDKLRLIEAITHRDPARPNDIDRRIPIDLSTIVLKALSKDPRQRFASAGEFGEELRRFVENRPIRSRPAPLHERYWRWCKRNPLLAASNIIAIVLATVITLGATVAALLFYAKNDELRLGRESASREAERAVSAERRAQRKSFDALVSQARAGRLSRRVGQRFESLAAIDEASRLLKSLDLSEREKALHRLELRNLAISSLALPDVHTVWSSPRATDHSYGIDDEGTLLVDADARGNLVIRRLADGNELARLAGQGHPRLNLKFSPDRRHLLFEENQEAASNLFGWRLGEKLPFLDMAGSRQPWQARFSGDGSALALVRVPADAIGGRLEVYDFPSTIRRFSLPLEDARALDGLVELQFSPDGSRLAICSGQQHTASRRTVRVFDAKSGREVVRHVATTEIVTIAWHPAGKIVAMGSQRWNQIFLWDIEADRVVRTISEQREQSPWMAFTRTGEFLASTGAWGTGKLSLFHSKTGRELFQLPTYDLFRQASIDGRLLSLSRADPRLLEIREIVPGREYRSLTRGPVADRYKFVSVSIHPGGRLMAGGNEAGLVFWDLETGEEVGFRSQGSTHVWFEPISGALWTSSESANVERWPVVAIAEGFRIGPPVTRLDDGGSVRSLRGSDDGSVVAASHRDGLVILSSDPARGKSLLGTAHEVRRAEVSPDGRWIVSRNHPYDGSPIETRLWDVRARKMVRDIYGWPIFSPDRRHMLAATPGGPHRIWEIDGWKPGPEVIEPAVGAFPAFSPDGRLLAIGVGEVIRLIDPTTGEQVASLDGPAQEVALMIDFTPDGNKLVAAGNGNPPFVQVWDLRLIRGQLRERELDWDPPALTPKSAVASASTLRVELLDLPVKRANLYLDARLLRDKARMRLALNPTDGEAPYLLGKALNAMDRPEEAFARLVAARQLQPDRVDVYHQRSMAGIRLRRWADVIADADAGLKRDPTHVSLRTNRGLALQKLGRHDEAIAEFTSLLAKTGRDFEISYWRADSLAALGRDVEAERNRREADGAATVNDLNGHAWSLANGLLGEVAPGRAVAVMRRVLAIVPDDPTLLGTLGAALYRDKQYEEAVSTLEASLETATEKYEPFDLVFIAMARHRLGQTARARQALDKAIWWTETNEISDEDDLALMKSLQEEAKDVLATFLSELPPDVFTPRP